MNNDDGWNVDLVNCRPSLDRPLSDRDCKVTQEVVRAITTLR